jgi:hypothetical protein
VRERSRVLRRDSRPCRASARVAGGAPVGWLFRLWGGEGLAADYFAFGGAFVLDGPVAGLVEVGGGAEGPVGIAEEFAGERDYVGLAGADDLVGLGGLGDHADGAGGEAGFAADAVGEGDLVAGADGDLLARVVAAGGDVEEVDAFGFDETGEVDDVFDGEAVRGVGGGVDPVGGGDADPDGEMGGEGGADGADDFEGKTGSIDEAAAVLVGAVIGEGGEEFVEEIAVGGVDFGEEEAGGGGAVGGGGEVGEDLVHAGAVEGVGEGIDVVKTEGRGGDYVGPATFGGREGAGGRVPGEGHAGFAAGVGELDGGNAAVSFEEVGDAEEEGDVVVGIDAEVAGGDAAFGTDGGGFGDDGACAADGTGAEMDEMPVVGVAVG